MADLEALRVQLEKLTQTIQEQQAVIADQGERLADQAQHLKTVAPQPVVVKVPPPPMRLGTFTGLAPKGGQEVAFKEWKDKVDTLLVEGSEDGEQFRRVKASLKGLALNQVKDAKTSEEIVNTLANLYGEVKTAEEQYIEFIKMRPTKSEQPSNFFSRLWEKFVILNEEGIYEADEAQKKLYYAFSSAIKESHPLLSLELRNKFGTPGAVKPETAAVLRAVREMEGSSASAAQANQAQTSAAPTIDYERLATMVAEKMAAQQRPTARGRSGPCYRCGEVGTHYKRDCRNPPNPARVAQAKKQALNG
ncbi:uncharacterized protein [Littorina saxatilis]|uniref:uncharacterized protein n=1 Tax=Littorina saxatilis TaxID=31220 RepID=UPI0038B50D82